MDFQSCIAGGNNSCKWYVRRVIHNERYVIASGVAETATAAHAEIERVKTEYRAYALGKADHKPGTPPFIYASRVLQLAYRAGHHNCPFVYSETK